MKLIDVTMEEDEDGGRDDTPPSMKTVQQAYTVSATMTSTGVPTNTRRIVAVAVASSSEIIN